MDPRDPIQSWQRRFVAASLLFTLLLACLAVLDRHERAARQTITALAGLGGKIADLRMATVSLQRVVTDCRASLPPGYGKRSVEALLFDRLDELNALFPGAQLLVSAPVELPEGYSIPFSVTLNQVSYGRFLKGVAALQAKTFPFVTVRSISISYEQPDKGRVAYKLEGSVVAPVAGSKGVGP